MSSPWVKLSRFTDSLDTHGGKEYPKFEKHAYTYVSLSIPDLCRLSFKWGLSSICIIFWFDSYHICAVNGAILLHISKTQHFACQPWAQQRPAISKADGITTAFMATSSGGRTLTQASINVVNPAISCDFGDGSLLCKRHTIPQLYILCIYIYIHIHIHWVCIYTHTHIWGCIPLSKWVIPPVIWNIPT